MAREKFSQEVPHQREVRGVAGELEFSFLHSPHLDASTLGYSFKL
ncbi:MAG: hypothetical protein QOF93_518 [Verrucomicrobiota bacterium]